MIMANIFEMTTHDTHTNQKIHKHSIKKYFHLDVEAHMMNFRIEMYHPEFNSNETLGIEWNQCI